jgi:hypothetical protein
MRIGKRRLVRLGVVLSVATAGRAARYLVRIRVQRSSAHSLGHHQHGQPRMRALLHVSRAPVRQRPERGAAVRWP